MRTASYAALVALVPSIASGPVLAELVAPTTVPEPTTFEAQSVPTLVNRADILEFRALPSYSEPEWVTEFVEAGELPPVADRLPSEPLVYKIGNMPDGPGVYGDVLRHVIGGRPEGWNFWAGQSYGWGGVDIALVECLTRTGPLFQVRGDDLKPLPNLARSWEWVDDGHTLVVRLIEGARWSDGDPFDVEDVAFYWNDIIMDPEVTPLMGASQGTYSNASFEVIDDYTFSMTFETPYQENVLFAFAYGSFCPGPSHVLKPHHPNYGGESYEEFRNAFPADFMNFPTMGAWAVVEHRPDDIMVMRRNPFYWKVDETGQQLPYIDEVQVRLSTWADRDVQAVAGSADLSNLEQPENFVASLQRSTQETAPARLAFGPRSIGYQLMFNMSANGWGEPDERAQAVRELNRNLDFRKAVTYAMDRQRLGDALVRGPFTAIYPGGLLPSAAFYDPASTVYYPFSVESAKASLSAAGLMDTDGNGFVNLPDGDDLNVTILTNADYATDRSLAEGVIAMMADAGVRVTLASLPGKDYNNARQSGAFDWVIRRVDAWFVSATQNTVNLAPVGLQTSDQHRANASGEIELLPFESEMVAAINTFVGSSDPAVRVQAMRDYQRIFTENVNSVGLTVLSGALIVNKRLSNVPEGTPIRLYQWAEDSLMRERLFTALDSQLDAQLHPQTLPGSPGAPGPVTAR